MTSNSTTRFSNRVENYVKYRPGYPAEVPEYLYAEAGLQGNAIIADIGSGTGISTELFLNRGHEVFAVEPNKEMRDKATALLGHYPGYREKDGTAEHTGLPPGSIDAIIAGQAFHWFDQALAKAEFLRILKPEGLIVLMWNERLTGSAFEADYDQLIVKHGKDYVQVDHRNIDTGKIAAFFSPATFQTKVLYNKQVFDFDGLKGRLLSSSYMPSADEPGYDAMVDDLKRLFDQHQVDGHITINYDTKVYSGKLKQIKPML